MSDAPTVAFIVRRYLAPTETFIIGQIRSLKRHRPIVLCHHRREQAAGPSFPLHAVAEELGPLPRWCDSASYALLRRLPSFSARRLARDLVTEKARLLHFQYLVDARFFLSLKRLTGLPSVVSAYGYDVSSFPRRARGYGLRYLQPVFREIDCVLAMSTDMRKDLLRLGCPAEKIIVHYYGIPTRRFAWPERPYPPRNIVNLLMIGTLEIKKSQHRVLQAVRMWEQKAAASPTCRFTIVGDGPMRGELEALVRDYGWQDRISFLGHVPHDSDLLVQCYREADIFALPSVTVEGDKEGIPGTLIEAMASGLPVVSTYHAGIPEVVEHDRTGLLVEERDLPALAEALGRLITDGALRQRLGRAAQEGAVRLCNLEEKTDELEAIYDRLLRGGLPAGGRKEAGN